jgi:hypothetical protein
VNQLCEFHIIKDLTKAAILRAVAKVCKKLVARQSSTFSPPPRHSSKRFLT